MSLIIRPNRIQVRVMVSNKMVNAEVVKCNTKTVIVKLENGDIIKVRNFKIAGG